MALSENSIKAAHEVQDLHGELKRHRNPELLRMGEMKKQYDGDIVLPFPELNTAERPAVANLIALGIDQNAMSVASVRPAIIFDALSTTDAAIRRASDSRNAVIGWQDMNDWDLLGRRRARHLVAYGETIVSLSPAGMTSATSAISPTGACATRSRPIRRRVPTRATCSLTIASSRRGAAWPGFSATIPTRWANSFRALLI